LDTIKAAPQEAEKKLAELKEKLPALQQAVDAARKAVEAAQKTVADKQTAASTGAGGPELETAKQDAATKVAAQTDAEKQLTARKNDVTQAEAALAKIRSGHSANVTAAEKALQQASTALAEAQKPAPAAPEVTSAEQELAKVKTALDTATAAITSAKADAERWKVAKVLQNAHDAHDALINKQAQYDQLVQEIKDAPQAIEKAKSDLAAAKKAVADGPTKLQENEKALAKSQEALESAKKALATAEDATKEKEKAASAAMEAAPTMGDVVNLTKKMETLNADAAKLREERNSHSQGTPEYIALQEKYQAKKAEILSTQTALTAASAKNMESPAIKAAQAEIDKARTAADDARRALKTATKAATTAEKGADQIKKDLAAATQVAARLEKDMPQIVKDAESEKTKAEQAAAVAAKEVEAAKAEAEKRRADFETLKSTGAKAAAVQHPTVEVVATK
jgi:chromosome segregation ATPase